MMRRNNNMGSRGGGGGPLMTDHLQDLELELELLKRKRQLIQQQQNDILYRPDVRQAAYNQPRQMFEDRFDRSHLYEEAPRAPPFAPKRRPVPVWDNAPGDGYGGPMALSKKPRQGPFPPQRLMDNNPPFRPRPEMLPSLLGPKPLMGFGHLQPKNQGPRPRAFQPKFKRPVKPGPSKPNLPPQNPAPVAQSSAPVAPKPELKRFVLTEDAVLDAKVNGRLEQALGTILKYMKANHKSDEHVILFNTPPLARLIKQGIRDRVRTAMLGKVVGTGQDITAEYRKQFPPSTDVDILKLAEVEKVELDQKQCELPIKLLEEGDPELYFKKNVTKLLEVKLDEMFQKVEKLYNEESVPASSEVVENLPEVTKAPTEESLKADYRDRESNTSVVATKHPKEEEYDKWMSLLMQRKLPDLLAKRKDDIIKALDLDDMFRTTKAAIIMHANNKSLHLARAQYNSGKLPESGNDDPDLPKNFYFAKVHARPAMPKRKLMQDFLKQFSPQTIKRHKKNFNLLFVGFADKAECDRLLKADQTKIDNATLTILGNVPKGDQSSVIEIKDASDDLEQVLTPQLDDQINDLLTSIRKADEDAKGTNGDANTQDVTMEDTAGNSEVTNGNDNDVEEVKDDAMEVPEDAEATNGNDSDVEEIKDDAVVVAVDDDVVEADTVAPLKSDAPVTPAKGRAPATPSTIRTRRASRLAQNN